MIVRFPARKGWADAARLELFNRDVDDIVAEIACDETGPHRVGPVRGMH